VGEVLDRRLVYVTGKGGVGRTTVAAALGLAAARAGKRTMVCEVAEQDRITRAFDRPPAGFRETEVTRNLHTFSIDPRAATEEWLRFRLHSGALASLLGQSRVFHYLTAAAPGLSELVTIGKIWELAQLQRKTARAAPYDLVVVDAPATGHGIALLRAPRTFAEIARAGPLHHQARKIDSFVTDPSFTAVIGVALAEEMPINETIDLERRLREQLGMKLSAVLVNAVVPERFSAAEAKQIESVDGAGSPSAREALAAALAARERARGQRSQLSRLRRRVGARVATLPLLPTPEVAFKDLEGLSRHLERTLP
jgi:Anion-transporting ATPase